MDGIVVTGASSGLGAAIAKQLARPGCHLLLTGRNSDRLAAVGAACEALGARVDPLCVDVRDAERMGSALALFDAATPVSTLIANAGESGGRSTEGAAEGLLGARRLAEVNYLGVLNTIEPLYPAMAARGAGRIGVMSSLAALRPIATMPGYAGSKAAAFGYGSALRAALRPHGVTVSVIAPGFVTTPMSERHQGPRPFEISAADAARIVVDGVERGRGLIAFPWQMVLLARLGTALPTALADRLARRFDADIAPRR